MDIEEFLAVEDKLTSHSLKEFKTSHPEVLQHLKRTTHRSATFCCLITLHYFKVSNNLFIFKIYVPVY